MRSRDLSGQLRACALVALLGAVLLTIGCGNKKPQPKAETVRQANEPATSLPNGLLLSYAQFRIDAAGKVTSEPGPARLEILRKRDGKWLVEVIEDADSNVFHKAMLFQSPGKKPGILTLGGMKAMVKLWHRQAGAYSAKTLWQEQFGGKFDRMRDAEIADVNGTSVPAVAVGTHDQGVVAILQPTPTGEVQVQRIDKQANTFIHEIEIGDLDADGVLEIYATPSEPNKLSGGSQRGSVVRYVPKKKQARQVVVDLGDRHAKEIFVGDVDGDGRDELYVAVEALTKQTDKGVEIVEPVEIRRFDHGTAATKGRTVATIPDRLCRFLTVGDIDGDGRREMVAAAYRSGLWLLRPNKDPQLPWRAENIERESSGFEHAATLADLDNDGRHELYVAADDQGELRQYTWRKGQVRRETLLRRPQPKALITWNIVAFPINALE